MTAGLPVPKRLLRRTAICGREGGPTQPPGGAYHFELPASTMQESAHEIRFACDGVSSCFV